MWYWTLPSIGITALCLLLPNYINAAANWAATGHVRINYEN